MSLRRRHTIRFNRPLRGANRLYHDEHSPVGKARFEKMQSGDRNQPIADDRDALHNDSEHDVFEALRDRLSEMAVEIGELKSNKLRALRELQEFAIRLSVTIAHVVVCGELQSSQDRVRSLVESAFDDLPDESEVVFQLNPRDLERLNESLFSDFKDNSTIRFVANPSVLVGDCQVDAGRLHLIATADDQLKTIEKRLTEVLSDAQAERRSSGGDRTEIGRVPDRRGIA